MYFDFRGPKDPDAMLVPVFKNIALKDEKRSQEEGRPIYEDVEHVELHAPGSKNYHVHPVTEFCGWKQDPITGEQQKITYAERFSHQYVQFRASQQQTKTGTPLDYAPFLTEARRAELRALNVYTVEQLSGVDGQELKNLGIGGRDMKNRAAEWMEDQKATAPNQLMQAELDAMRAKNQILEEDNALLKQRAASAEQQFEDMSDEQLIDYIKNATGFAPTGNLPRKQLIAMAMQNTRSSRMVA